MKVKVKLSHKNLVDVMPVGSVVEITPILDGDGNYTKYELTGIDGLTYSGSTIYHCMGPLCLHDMFERLPSTFEANGWTTVPGSKEAYHLDMTPGKINVILNEYPFTSVEQLEKATRVELNEGTPILISVMPEDSFYTKVKGAFKGLKNGRVDIEATEVISKWSDQWKDHPTSCRTSGKAENTAILTKIK